jgi:hypothetical protein
MDKRYQIFVSSTFSDLVAERQAVMQALLNLNHFPAGMELFPASDEDQWALIRGVIDDSDYYIIVVAGRYGSVTSEGITYTEKELDHAVSSGIPVLAFVHKSPEDLAAKLTDQNDEARRRLEALREKITKGRHVKFWSGADDLSAKVIQSVSAETKRNPRVGWVRANLSSDPSRLNELMNENEALKLALSQARYSPPSGTERYAQGQEQFRVSFHVGRSRYDDYEVRAHHYTWDDLLYEAGPLMMDEASEKTIKARFSQELPLYKGAASIAKFSWIQIADDSFETIKIQFLALGLMQKSIRKHAPSDTNVYWSLTPYGEQRLMRLRAIDKSA